MRALLPTCIFVTKVVFCDNRASMNIKTAVNVCEPVLLLMLLLGYELQMCGCATGCSRVCVGLTAEDWCEPLLIHWVFLSLQIKLLKQNRWRTVYLRSHGALIFNFLWFWGVRCGIAVWISLFRHWSSLMFHFLGVISGFIHLLSFTLWPIQCWLKDFFFKLNWKRYFIQPYNAHYNFNII